MLQKYSSLTSATGRHIAGICKLKIIPKEWLSQQWIANFATGKVDTIAVVPGREFITINLIANTYKYAELPKDNKAGSYFDILLTGSSNDIDEVTLQVLNTFRYHQWVAIYKDMQGRYKIAGNYDAAMIFEYNNAEENEGGGKQKVDIKLAMSQELAAAFFTQTVIAISPKLGIADNFSIAKVAVDTFELTWAADATWPIGYDVEIERSTSSNFSSALTSMVVLPADISTYSFRDAPGAFNTTFFYRVKITATGYTDSDYNYANLSLPNIPGLTQDHLWGDFDADGTGVEYTTSVGIKYVDSWAEENGLTAGSGRNFVPYLDAPILEFDATISANVIGNTNDPNANLVTESGSELLPNNATGQTIFIVGSQSAADDTSGPFIRCGENIVLIRNGDNTGLLAKMRNVPNILTVPDIEMANDTYYTIRLHFDGTNHSICINNGTVHSLPASTANYNPASLWLFRRSSTGSNKKFARLVIYEAALTPAEIAQNEAYLRWRYGHY